MTTGVFLLQLNCLLFIFFFSSSHYTCRFPSLTFLSGRVFNQEIIVHTVLAGLPTTRLSRLSASRSMGTQGIITIRCGLRQLLEGQYSAGPGNEPNYWRFHVLPLARSSWKALPKLCNYSRRNFKINAKLFENPNFQKPSFDICRCIFGAKWDFQTWGATTKDLDNKLQFSTLTFR